jgi:hypothetical protein
MLEGETTQLTGEGVPISSLDAPQLLLNFEASKDL